jgi:hypothetical protein
MSFEPGQSVKPGQLIDIIRKDEYGPGRHTNLGQISIDDLADIPRKIVDDYLTDGNHDSYIVIRKASASTLSQYPTAVIVCSYIGYGGSEPQHVPLSMGNIILNEFGRPYIDINILKNSGHIRGVITNVPKHYYSGGKRKKRNTYKKRHARRRKTQYRRRR